MNKFLNSLKRAITAGVPMVAVECNDGLDVVSDVLSEYGEKFPIIRWDLSAGAASVNPLAQGCIADLGDPLTTTRPDEMLAKMLLLPDQCITIMLGADAILTDSTVIAAMNNLRDPFKSSGRMAILVVPLGFKLPTALKDNAVVVAKSLPSRDEIVEMSQRLSEDSGIAIDGEVAASALRGLGGFAAETALAMALNKDGVDTGELWSRKISAIEQTVGLSVCRDTKGKVAGLATLQGFLTKLVKGTRPYRSIVFIDEIEKSLGAGEGDTSGVSQEMRGEFLKWTQDSGLTGLILLGHAGCGKSAVAKQAGETAGIPVIEFGLSAMKGSLVGQSTANMRAASAAVDALSDRNCLMIATCNRIDALTPEIRRRFTLGTWFVDLPDETERDGIWNLWMGRYKVAGDIPMSVGWTGGEIKSCCDIADRLGCSLVDASRYILPSCRSAAEQIESLRKGAAGRYLSASYDGAYRYEQAATAGRRINV